MIQQSREFYTTLGRVYRRYWIFINGILTWSQSQYIFNVKNNVEMIEKTTYFRRISEISQTSHFFFQRNKQRNAVVLYIGRLKSSRNKIEK